MPIIKLFGKLAAIASALTLLYLYSFEQGRRSVEPIRPPKIEPNAIYPDDPRWMPDPKSSAVFRPKDVINPALSSAESTEAQAPVGATFMGGPKSAPAFRPADIPSQPASVPRKGKLMGGSKSRAAFTPDDIGVPLSKIPVSRYSGGPAEDEDLFRTREPIQEQIEPVEVPVPEPVWKVAPVDDSFRDKW